jgi:hypothetical protein
MVTNPTKMRSRKKLKLRTLKKVNTMLIPLFKKGPKRTRRIHSETNLDFEVENWASFPWRAKDRICPDFVQLCEKICFIIIIINYWWWWWWLTKTTHHDASGKINVNKKYSPTTTKYMQTLKKHPMSQVWDCSQEKYPVG